MSGSIDDLWSIAMTAGTNQYPIPPTMKAWVLGNPDELSLAEKPVPEPGPAEVLVRIDAIAVCATDIEILKHGLPALIEGELPFNKGFTPGHEYMGTVVKPRSRPRSRCSHKERRRTTTISSRWAWRSAT